MDMDGHAVWVNSKMLEIKGIDKNTLDPPGGTIVKDPETGEPTGLFLDDAMFLIDTFAIDANDPDSYGGSMQALAMLSSGGVTSFVEAMTFEGYEELFRKTRFKWRPKFSCKSITVGRFTPRTVLK